MTTRVELASRGSTPQVLGPFRIELSSLVENTPITLTTTSAANPATGPLGTASLPYVSGSI